MRRVGTTAALLLALIASVALIVVPTALVTREVFPVVEVTPSPSPSPVASPSPVVIKIPFSVPSPSPSPVMVPGPTVTVTVRPSASPASRSETRSLPSIAQRIADCESGDRLKNGRAVEGSYDLRAENGTSTASGKYQAINGTWAWKMGPEYPPPASRWPEEVQDQFFLRLWDGGKGASHWSESRGCWG